MSIVGVGDPYLEDNLPEVKVVINYLFHSNYYLEKIDILYENNERLICYVSEKGLVVQYLRCIPEKLYEDIKKEASPKYFYGYLSSILNYVNQEIQKQKYQYGYILMSQLSIFKLKSIVIQKIPSDEVVEFEATLNIQNIVPKSDILTTGAPLFIRDYLDSMTAYLNMELEDCIRRLITSIENYFYNYKISGEFKVKLNSVLNCKSFKIKKAKYRNIIRKNLQLLHHCRNLIIHNNLRVDYSFKWYEIGHKGISSISYLYLNSIEEKDWNEFLQKLGLEFNTILMIINKFNLDQLKAGREDLKENKKEESMDDFMFSRLEYSKEVKKIIR